MPQPGEMTLTMDNKAEMCTCVSRSVGVDARQQVGGKIGPGGFFEGSKLVSIIIIKSIVSYIWI